MRKREQFFIVFFIFLFLSLAILGLSLSGNLRFFSSVLEKIASPIQGLTYGFFQRLPFGLEDQAVKKQKEVNMLLTTKLVDEQKLQKENAALLDQFQTAKPRSSNLLPARIVGALDFIPGVTTPSSFILDKGKKDNVNVGYAVVFKNNLVGSIVKVSSYLSKVDLVTNVSSSFTAKTINGALGVIKGSGRGMTLDNVLLSENIKPQEIVLTSGDINLNGTGYPPDLIVGKIQSIDKNPSSLFQRAKLESLINFPKLSTVFIVNKIE